MQLRIKKTRIIQLILIIIIIATILIDYYFPSLGFYSGYVSGVSWTTLIFYTIGKRQANRAAEMLNKHLRDQIVENYKIENND